MMTPKTKGILAVVSLLSFTVGVGIIYLACQNMLSMPFRATNDTLHQQSAVITLDFLIPGGTHIDEQMTIKDVISIRFAKQKGGLNNLVNKISESIPLKYRLLATTLLYLFWTLLFLVFFRIFTWMRYMLALGVSFIAGGLVYFFMPDLVTGRADDAVFLGWAIVFVATVRWYSRKRKQKSSL